MICKRPKSKARQAGFTMAEVMVALIVFIVAVIGLVAMEKRGIEAQRASMETREAERLAQEVMAELQASSFNELVFYDFAGGNAALPYDDVALGTAKLRDYGAVPNATGERAPGTRKNFYWVGRKVNSWPPGAAGNPDAITLEVYVLWIDTTNPALPPPANVGVADLRPANLDPADPNYLPYVRGIQLRTVRVNDAGAPL